jgi:hypothetical protein
VLGAHFFYQVSEEEITRAQTLAGMLEIPLPHAIGMALVVKRAAIRVSGTAGTIPGDPATWCAAQVGWPQADAKRLLDALLCAGHVLAIAGPSPGHSVAFLGPLQAMEETSKKRSEAGKKGAETRKSKGGYGRATAGLQPGYSHGMARDGKKETEMEKETDLSASQEPADAVPLPDSRPFTLEEQQPPGKPKRKARTPSEAEDLFKLLQRQREERCAEVGEPFVPERWEFARQNAALVPLLKGPESDRELFDGGWGAYLADDGERARKPAWSLAYFMKAGVRAMYETKAAREAAA